MNDHKSNIKKFEKMTGSGRLPQLSQVLIELLIIVRKNHFVSCSTRRNYNRAVSHSHRSNPAERNVPALSASSLSHFDYVSCRFTMYLGSLKIFFKHRVKIGKRRASLSELVRNRSLIYFSENF